MSNPSNPVHMLVNRFQASTRSNGNKSYLTSSISNKLHPSIQLCCIIKYINIRVLDEELAYIGLAQLINISTISFNSMYNYPPYHSAQVEKVKS